MHKRNALEGVEDGYHPTSINRLGTSDECGKLIAWLLSVEASFVRSTALSADRSNPLGKLLIRCLTIGRSQALRTLLMAAGKCFRHQNLYCQHV